MTDEVTDMDVPRASLLAAGAAGAARPFASGLLKATRLVTVLGLVAQLAAFARTAIIAAALGASLDVDAYNLGLIAPTFIATVIGGWLQVGFIGRYTGLLATENHELAAAYRTSMMLLVLALAALVTLGSFCFAAPIMNALVPSSQPAIQVAGVAALRLAGWILVPTIVGDFLGIVLNSHGRFLAAALAPVINGAASAAALLIWPKADLRALVWTLVFGTVLQLCMVLIGLIKLRLHYSLALRSARNEVCATLLIAVPLLPAMMLANAAAGIIQVHAAEFGEGAVSLYGYSSRLHVALTQILVIGLGTVLLPHLASLWARREIDAIVLLFRRLARIGLLVTAYLTVGIVLIGDTAVGALLGRGKLEAGQVGQVGLLWGVLSLSLFPFAFGTYIAKLAQAMRRGGAILVSSTIGFAATWGTAAVGAHWSSLPIVVGAIVTSPILVTCYWVWWMSRYMPVRPVLQDIGIAALRMAIVVPPTVAADLVMRRLVEHYSPFVEAIVRGGVYTVIVVGILVITRAPRWFLASPAATV